MRIIKVFDHNDIDGYIELKHTYTEASVKKWESVRDALVVIRAISGEVCGLCELDKTKSGTLGCSHCPLKDPGEICCKEFRVARDSMLQAMKDTTAMVNRLEKLAPGMGNPAQKETKEHSKDQEVRL